MRKPGSVGLPFANMEVDLRLDDGRPASAGEVGELFARGPTAFSRYWNRPDSSAAAPQRSRDMSIRVPDCRLDRE